MNKKIFPVDIYLDNGQVIHERISDSTSELAEHMNRDDGSVPWLLYADALIATDHIISIVECEGD